MNNKILIIACLIFIFSIGCVYSQDTDDLNATTSSSFEDDSLSSSDNVVNGSVSGDVEVITENPWNTTGELNYDIPSEANDIKMANVYVNIYSGSGRDISFVLDSNTTLTTCNGTYNLGYEVLETTECSMDGTVYTIDGNDHVTRVYSDYQINYDVTDYLKGLNGTSISIKVDSIKKSVNFDGRIKLIALVLAYDDGDNDVINYWVDYNQYYTKTNIVTTLDTASIEKLDSAIWTDVVLSSTDASYRVNDRLIFNKIEHSSGNYYNFNKWDVTKNIIPLTNTSFTYYNNGDSAKSVLSVLTMANYETPSVNISSIVSEYDDIAYPGTINALTVNLVSSKEGTYAINLYADENIVNTTEVRLSEGNNKIVIVDPTIRSVDESTVIGNNNKNVKWRVEISFYNRTVANKEMTAKILYNGYLGSEYAYNIEGFKSFLNVSFTGDIVVDIKTTYSSAGSGSRSDSWNVNLDDKSTIVGGFIMLPYNWFNYDYGSEDINMIQATFNGKSVKATGFAHDNPNIGWNMGYGVLIFDVGNLINPSGTNTLNLNRIAGSPALNPSVFVYYYNTTGSSTINNMYMVKGYDLLLNDFNKAGRINRAESIIDVNSSEMNNATIYIFAAGADRNDGYVVINGQEFKKCWNGESYTTDLFKTNITGIIKESNMISFISTGGTVSALPQFIIINKNFTEVPSNNINNYSSTVKTEENKVIPVATKITAKKATFKANKKVKKYSITLKAGKTPVKNVQVTIKIGKKTYKAKTNAKGKATFKIKKLTKKGTYKAKISFKGNQNYKAASKTVKIKIK